jgi:DNA-binding PadR family transcriptional regulator
VEDRLPLHPTELRILMSLLDGPSYGTRIVEDVESRERGRVALYPANLYRRIRDLMARELIEVTDSPAGSDPRRTYLRMTRLGRSVARAEVRRLQELLKEAADQGLMPDSSP